MEHNIVPTIDKELVAVSKQILPKEIFSLFLYDPHPPPDYPYARALSAYSAVIQLYSRSGQLDSASTLSSRLNDLTQPWCRFGCPNVETTHHLFTCCPRFSALRDEAVRNLRAIVNTTFDTFRTSADHHTQLSLIVDGLFKDGHIWPTAHTFFYCGLIPMITLNDAYIPHLSVMQRNRLQQRLAHDCHSASIRLASRIWGIVRRSFSPYSSSRPRKQITLPHQLSHITSAMPNFHILHRD